MIAHSVEFVKCEYDTFFSRPYRDHQRDIVINPHYKRNCSAA